MVAICAPTGRLERVNTVEKSMGITENELWADMNAELEKLPPYLSDTDVTVERFYQAHQDKFLTMNAAQKWLSEMVKAGKMKKERRRNPEGGTNHAVFIPVKSD